MVKALPVAFSLTESLLTARTERKKFFPTRATNKQAGDLSQQPSVSGFEISLCGPRRDSNDARVYYWIALPTCENTVLAFVPIKRTVPITITRITASMTAYSAMSWPCSSFHTLFRKFLTVFSL